MYDELIIEREILKELRVGIGQFHAGLKARPTAKEAPPSEKAEEAEEEAAKQAPPRRQRTQKTHDYEAGFDHGADYDWLLQKTTAFSFIIAYALRRRQSWSQVSAQADILYKELSARFAMFQRLYRDGYGKQELDGIGRSIYLLNILGSATLNQKHFIAIYLAVQRARGWFQRANNVLGSWTPNWQVSFHGDNIDSLRGFFETLISNSAGVSALALEAATICDEKELEKRWFEICRVLTAYVTYYREITCRMEFLRSSPNFEPGFDVPISRMLARGGYFIQTGLGALGRIRICRRDWVRDLRAAWEKMETSVQALEEEIEIIRKSRLCATVGICRDELSAVRIAVRAGLEHAHSLESDCRASEIVRQQLVYVEQVETSLSVFSKKGVRWGAFHGFWWAMAEIRSILAWCCPERDDCVLTAEELEKLVGWVKGKVRPGAWVHSHGLNVCCERVATPSRPAATQEPAPVRPASATPAPALLNEIKNAAIVASDSIERVATEYRSTVRKLHSELQDASNFLERSVKEGKSLQPSQSRQFSSLLKRASTILTEAFTLSEFGATTAGKAELDQLKRRVSERVAAS